MKKFALLRMLHVLVALAVLSCLSLPVFAQRGGHGGGGGGGFHGGSVGGGFHGGGGYSGYGGRGFYGGYRGGGNYGWRGGYYGWRGGYGGYGYGWGLGFGFGWPYWWGYPYGYSYSPGWAAPYPYYDPNYYPNACPPGYTCTYNGNDNPPPSNPGPKSESYPAKPWRRSVPEGPANANYDTNVVVASETRTPGLSAGRMTATQSNYRVVQRATQEDPALRPEVRHAMHALREMPPFAREREIATGRYSDFSPQEKEFLRSLN